MVKPNEVLGDGQNFLKTADGTMARKGSIAALMATANAIDNTKTSDISEDLEDIRSLIPTLHGLGFFEFFTPLEWLQEIPKLREGKCWVALLYIQTHPEKMTESIRLRFLEILPMVSKSLQKAIKEQFKT